MSTQESTHLLTIMTSFSQKLFKTPWEPSLEYVLYDVLTQGPIHTMHGRVDHIEVDQLRQAAQRANGWWVETDYGFEFIAMSDWLEHLESIGEL